jgi:acetoin utilization deacetylase AcuC-like enzyme
VRPPGHGAGPARAGQHGLVNSVAVAAGHLRRRRGIEHLLVVDLGGRAGLGTVEILASDPGVRLLLASADAGSVADDERVLAAGLPADAGADAVLAALAAGLERALGGFEPDFLLLSLGFDLLATDPTASLRLEPRDYHRITGLLRSAAAGRCGGRLVSVLEEGYDPAGLGAGVVQHLRGLAGLPAA